MINGCGAAARVKRSVRKEGTAVTRQERFASEKNRKAPSHKRKLWFRWARTEFERPQWYPHAVASMSAPGGVGGLGGSHDVLRHGRTEMTLWERTISCRFASQIASEVGALQPAVNSKGSRQRYSCSHSNKLIETDEGDRERIVRQWLIHDDCIW